MEEGKGSVVRSNWEWSAWRGDGERGKKGACEEEEEEEEVKQEEEKHGGGAGGGGRGGGGAGGGEEQIRGEGAEYSRVQLFFFTHVPSRARATPSFNTRCSSLAAMPSVAADDGRPRQSLAAAASLPLTRAPQCASSSKK
jgi:hypothetical protein